MAFHVECIDHVEIFVRDIAALEIAHPARAGRPR